MTKNRVYTITMDQTQIDMIVRSMRNVPEHFFSTQDDPNSHFGSEWADFDALRLMFEDLKNCSDNEVEGVTFGFCL